VAETSLANLANPGIQWDAILSIWDRKYTQSTVLYVFLSLKVLMTQRGMGGCIYFTSSGSMAIVRDLNRHKDNEAVLLLSKLGVLLVGWYTYARKPEERDFSIVT
jgi:hypothetical protein